MNKSGRIGKSRLGTVVLPLSTADGVFTAHYSGTGLWALDFPGGEGAGGEPERVSETVRGWHEATRMALTAALAGKQPVQLPPLDLSSGTVFQQQVWAVLRTIRPGQTWSYGQVAAALGKPGAVRAVGAACGANPIPVLVPCHRVLAARQALGGFSAGLQWKCVLLEREGSRWLEARSGPAFRLGQALAAKPLS